MDSSETFPIFKLGDTEKVCLGKFQNCYGPDLCVSIISCFDRGCYCDSPNLVQPLCAGYGDADNLPLDEGNCSL
jgi:hypothetical protein